ncbi:MAG: hypothetical protein J6V09_05755 [Clostridia bacterium]|nr:hypothetical protein [Clostridia bacterium]
MKINISIKWLAILTVSALILLCATSCGGESKAFELTDIDEGESANGKYSQFLNFGIQASGIGYGYDLIGAPYINGIYAKADAPIIDEEKLAWAGVKLTRASTHLFKEYSGDSIKELYEDYVGEAEQIGGCFAKALLDDFKEIDSSTFYYFYKGVYQVNLFSLCLTDSVEELRAMLSDEFKSDLNTLPPEMLYTKYGTHFIKDAAMGGRIEFCVTYSSNEAEYTDDSLAAVKAHIDYIGALVSGDQAASYGGECEREGITVNVRINQVGGPWIDTSSIEACTEMLTSWANAFDESPDYYASADVFSEDSLIGLWLLVEDINVERREELWRFFRTSVQNAYGELCDSFNVVTERTLTVLTDGNGEVSGNLTYYEKGDTATLVAMPNDNYDFDGWYVGGVKISSDREISFTVESSITLTAKFVKGEGMVRLKGSGTSTDPYIITKRDDFLEITKDMSAHYKLGNNIDFENALWTPIAGVFTGFLDGNNCIVSNLNVSVSAAPIDGKLYLGLFEQISRGNQTGGYIHGLHIRSSHITVSEEYGGDATIYAGFICGKNNGRIENCTFALTKVSVQTDKSYIGTVTGASVGEIYGCQLATVSLYGSGNIGGIAGYLAESATVKSCYVGGTASGSSKIELYSLSAEKSAGGIVGVSDGAEITYTEVKDTEFILSGDTGYLPAMGIVIGRQSNGDIPNLTDTSEYIEIKSSDASYTQYFFSIGWGICGRCD